MIGCDEDGRPCGLVTDRDLAVEVMAAERDPSRTAGDLLLGTTVATVEDDFTLGEAVNTMKERAVRRLPVTSEGKVVGVVSQATSPEWMIAWAGELIEVSLSPGTTPPGGDASPFASLSGGILSRA